MFACIFVLFPRPEPVQRVTFEIYCDRAPIAENTVMIDFTAIQVVVEDPFPFALPIQVRGTGRRSACRHQLGDFGGNGGEWEGRAL
jgi:hypothetical protein